MNSSLASFTFKELFGLATSQSHCLLDGWSTESKCCSSTWVRWTHRKSHTWNLPILKDEMVILFKYLYNEWIHYIKCRTMKDKFATLQKCPRISVASEVQCPDEIFKNSWDIEMFTQSYSILCFYSDDSSRIELWGGNLGGVRKNLKISRVTHWDHTTLCCDKI